MSGSCTDLRDNRLVSGAKIGFIVHTSGHLVTGAVNFLGAISHERYIYRELGAATLWVIGLQHPSSLSNWAVPEEGG